MFLHAFRGFFKKAQNEFTDYFIARIRPLILWES